MPSNWKEKVEKSFKTCPHCREKLPLRAKFCFYCGQKFEAIKPIPPISDLLQGEKSSKPIPSVSELKTEDKKIVSSSWQENVEKSFKTCPHCRQKLPLGAKFCVACGQKVEVLKTIPPISLIKESDGQININWLKHQYYDLGRTMQDIANEQGVSMIRIRKLLSRIEIISEKKEVESMTDVPPLKTEEVQQIQPISDIKENTPMITPSEEAHPISPISELLQGEKTSKYIPEFRDVYRSGIGITCPQCGQMLPSGTKFCAKCGHEIVVLKPTPPASDIKEEILKITPVEKVQPAPPILEKKEKKSKLKPRICEFCGMRIPKNNTFCLQCGMIIKIR